MDPDLMAEYAKEDPNGLKAHDVKRLNSYGLLLTMEVDGRTFRLAIPCITRMHYVYSSRCYLYIEDTSLEDYHANIEWKSYQQENAPGYKQFIKNPKSLYIEGEEKKTVKCWLLNEKGEAVPCKMTFEGMRFRDALQYGPETIHLL